MLNTSSPSPIFITSLASLFSQFTPLEKTTSSLIVIVSSPSFVSMMVFILSPLSGSEFTSAGFKPSVVASIFSVIFTLSSLSMILPSAVPDMITALFVVTLRVTPSL